MRKIILTIAFLSFAALIFSGCTRSGDAIDSPAVEIPSASSAVPDGSLPPEAPEGARATENPPEPEEPRECEYMHILWNGERIEPYKSFAWSDDHVVYEDGRTGWLCADGVGFGYELPEVIDELPVVGPDFEAVLDEDCRLDHAAVYDPETFEQTAFEIDSDTILKLVHAGFRDHVVEMVISHRGRYIEEDDKYEYSAFSCAFIVKRSQTAEQTEAPSQETAEDTPAATEPALIPAATPTAAPTPVPTYKPTPDPTPKPTVAPSSTDLPCGTVRPWPPETPEPSAAPDGELLKTGLMKVRAGGALYTPIEKHDFSKLYLDDIGGFINGDGLAFFDYLQSDEFCASLPIVPKDSDIEFVLADGCKVYRIDAFDPETRERLAHRITKAELDRMAADAENGLIAAVYVRSTGRCISGEYECWGNCYGFRIG